MAQEPRTAKAVSAGGVIHRRGTEGIEIVACGRSKEALWALPKGTPEAGETLEQTAVREVQEETGLRVEISDKVGSMRYRFTAGDGTLYDKRVDHFLMTAVGGRVEHHDREFDDVRWMPVEEAYRLLTYPNEREMVRRAVRLIEQRRE